MAQLQQTTVRNRLLAILPPSDFDLLAPALEPVSVPLRTILIASAQTVTHAYFVEEGLVSLLADTVEERIEIGLVGREGMVGVSLVLDADRAPHTALVQGDLVALRVAAPLLVTALDTSRTLRAVLGRYVQSLLVQVGQTAQASIDLTVEGRLARWILMTQDRMERDELPLTHEFLAIMLGVRRPGVTMAIHMLEGSGMIQARRGRITVLDRGKLKELVGGNYGVAEAEYERLLARA